MTLADLYYDVERREGEYQDPTGALIVGTAVRVGFGPEVVRYGFRYDLWYDLRYGKAPGQVLPDPTPETEPQSFGPEPEGEEFGLSPVRAKPEG